MILTPTRIAELRALAAGATPGPWSDQSVGEDYGCVAGRPTVDDLPESGLSIAMNITPEDADFIAAACNELPAALDELDRLRALLERAHKYLDRNDVENELRDEIAAELEVS